MKPVFSAFWLSGLSLLAACGSGGEPVAQTIASAENSSRPTLVDAGLDIVPVVAEAGAPWTGATLSDEIGFDADLGLQRRNVIYKGGSIAIDRQQMGGVYMIKVQTGGTGCGPAEPLVIAFAKLSERLKLPLLTERESAEMASAWQKSDGWFEVEKTGLTLRAIGGCQKSLVLKAVA